LQPTYQYVWSRRYIDAPVLRDKNTDADGLCDDERIYYLGDANFNVTTLVNTGGDAIERYVYTPYGVLTVYDATWANIRSTSSYANAYTYTGRQLDAETGLYYYRARIYAPQLGRFVTSGPATEITTPGDAKGACINATVKSPNRQTDPLPPFTTEMNAQCDDKWLAVVLSSDRIKKMDKFFWTLHCPPPLICCDCCRWGKLYNAESHSIRLCANNIRSLNQMETTLVHELTHALQNCYPYRHGSECERSIQKELEAYYCDGRCDSFPTCLPHAIKSSCGMEVCTPEQLGDPNFFNRLWQWFNGSLQGFCTPGGLKPRPVRRKSDDCNKIRQAPADLPGNTSLY
jgi:RHS repeat-associated protein